MRRLIKPVLLFLLLLSVKVVGQPGEMEKRMRFGLFDKKGNPIHPTSKRFTISFTSTNPRDKYVPQKQYRQEDIKFTGRDYRIEAKSNEQITISIRHRGKEMVLHTVASIDSIIFTPGTYTIRAEYGPLVGQIKTHGTARVTNFQLQHLTTGQTRTPPGYTFQSIKQIRNEYDREICNVIGKKLEQKHSGSGWAVYVCNDPKDMVAVEPSGKEHGYSLVNDTIDIRVKIYPLANGSLIKHEFIVSRNNINDYIHIVSASFDNGTSWRKLISVVDEWYVSIVYFPEQDMIGIGGQEFLLLSDYRLTDWKYYHIRYWEEDASIHHHVAALLLFGGNWYDNYPGIFSFPDRVPNNFLD